MVRKGLWRDGGIVLLAAAADRATKIWVPEHPCEISGFLRFREAVLNTGMAFSFLSNAGWVLTALIAMLTIGVIIWLLLDGKMPKLQRIGLCLIAGGALGNLYDRIAYGAVIDFIELLFVRFAVFNVADVCICAGAGLAILAMIIEEKRHAGKGV